MIRIKFVLTSIIFFAIGSQIFSQNGNIELEGKLGVGVNPNSFSTPVQVKANNQDNSIRFMDLNDVSQWFFRVYGNGNFSIWEIGQGERLTIEELGNIGIGITNPSEKLEVNGNIKLNGRIVNLTEPVDSQDAATKNYVDELENTILDKMLDAGLFGYVSDIEGNNYRTSKIGTQVWMIDNLRSTMYNNGTSIPNITDNGNWNITISPAYCWYENDSTMHAEIYGALYNYYTVADTNSLNICPVGWHIPSDSEWYTLSNYLIDSGYGFDGGGSDIGKAVASTYLWTQDSIVGNVGAEAGTNNLSGLTIVPNGVRISSGEFQNKGLKSSSHSSTESFASTTPGRRIENDYDELGIVLYLQNAGLGIRCIKD